MPKKNILSEEDQLKQDILNTEEKKWYYSDKYQKIEEKVKQSLVSQKTDEALEDITIGALVLWSSDVHYDGYKDYVQVRFRIDGILVDIFRLNHREYDLVKERLKYSSSLKLNITNIPQDGKYSLEIQEKKLDVRVSTLPIKYTENIVCRILDNSNTNVTFDELWFFWTSKRMLQRAITKRNGMILVTGPTGSWKTTTLYTILEELNTRDKKIITLEDPIEYELDWIIQSEVNEKNGFTFETGLKSLLRQDPDIIMVWEIRWLSTLQTATSASLTWHLVMSTLHTKSAADTLDRIINMWLPPYILASALDTIIAQRLVRKICPHCKEEKIKTPAEQHLITQMMTSIWMPEILSNKIKLYHGIGCSKCNNSWYAWRIGVYEIISLNDKLREIIRAGWSVSQVIEEARIGDLITMKEDWVLKAIRWYTTIEEILRVM